MLTLFQRKKAPPSAGTSRPGPADVSKGLTRPQSAAELLATARRQKLLEHIWQRTSLSRRQFGTLYLAPMQRYAELVQQLPASESYHHAYPGGMLMGAGTSTQGAVHCHQLKSLDWRAWNVRLKETVPQYIVDEALARIEAILFE